MHSSISLKNLLNWPQICPPVDPVTHTQDSQPPRDRTVGYIFSPSTKHISLLSSDDQFWDSFSFLSSKVPQPFSTFGQPRWREMIVLEKKQLEELIA